MKRQRRVKRIKSAASASEPLPTTGLKASARLASARVADEVYDAHLRPNLGHESDLVARIIRNFPEWDRKAAKDGPAARAGMLSRAMRIAAGLSQMAVGEKANIKQSDISAIETGSGEKGPTYDVLSRIADACGFVLSFGPKEKAPARALAHESALDADPVMEILGKMRAPQTQELPNHGGKGAMMRQKRRVIEVKEIKMRPTSDDYEYDTKMKRMKRFFDDGDKVKITLRFRGREMAHLDFDTLKNELSKKTSKVDPPISGYRASVGQKRPTVVFYNKAGGVIEVRPLKPGETFRVADAGFKTRMSVHGADLGGSLEPLPGSGARPTTTR